MINDHFINTFSSAIATYYKEYLKTCPEPINSTLKVEGMQGRSIIKIKNVFMDITTNQFKEFGAASLSQTKTLWNRIRAGTHILDARITHFLRTIEIFSDCVSVLIKENKAQFIFREASDLITQTPQAFLPLYRAKFHEFQEVIQGQFAITSAKNPKTSLGTWHLVECVAFTAFDELSLTGILAHIDRSDAIEQLFIDIKTSLDSSTNFKFNYVLTGGIETVSMRETIKKAAINASNENLSFCFVKETDSELPHDDFLKDSEWCTSMRLRRSIAINTRGANPLQNLRSYEPNINDNSSLHKRLFSRMEALRFEFNRDLEKYLQRVL